MRRWSVIDQVQKHTETAPDTPEKEGTKSSFPVKMHLIPGKTPAIYKIFCGANVVQKGKRKMQVFENKALAFYFGTLWTICFRTNLWKTWVGFIS